MIHIAGPIGVDKTVQGGPTRCPALENEVAVARGFEISERAVKGALVLFAWAR